jgi:hypothetical protein
VDTHNVASTEAKRNHSVAQSPVQSLAAQHIELLTGSPDTPMCFRGFRDNKADDAARKFNGTLAECWSQIEAMQREGWGHLRRRQRRRPKR